MTPTDIDYINAHGTSTMADTIELGAVKRLFGNAIGKVSMSSTKSAIGHLLGGAGAVEAIFCILAIRDQIVPPTLNLDNPDEGTEGVDLVPHKAQAARGQGRAQQQLRLRRHQCQPGDEGGLGRSRCAASSRSGWSLIFVAGAARCSRPSAVAVWLLWVGPGPASSRADDRHRRAGLERRPGRGPARARPARSAAARGRSAASRASSARATRSRRANSRSRPALSAARHPRPAPARPAGAAAGRRSPKACRRCWCTSG